MSMQADLNIDSPIFGQQILVRDPDAVRLKVYTPNGWLAVHDFGYMDDMTFDAFIHLWPRLYHLLLTGTWLRESCPYEALH